MESQATVVVVHSQVPRLDLVSVLKRRGGFQIGESSWRSEWRGNKITVLLPVQEVVHRFRYSENSPCNLCRGKFL